MKKLLVGAIALACASGVAHAAPVAGFDDFHTSGGNMWNFVFDGLPADVDGKDGGGNPVGIIFTEGSLTVTATGSSGGSDRVVRQDHPADGGLGVLGSPNGDNLGIGEILTLTFSRAVDILGFTLNDGHTDAATGGFTFGPLSSTADLFDGVGSEGAGQGDLCSSYAGFCGVTSISLSSTGFTGYLESIKVQAVPLPAPLGLLLVGAAGLGLAARKRRGA
ncbi:hypothetical protein [Roseibium sp.]|uniref:hypothetical protein n=1 Tax=Roseibium sp. TaxID=1936156 RepID=UPI003BAABF2E